MMLQPGSHEFDVPLMRVRTYKSELLRFTLMLQTQTGKTRCARAIARYLRLCSPRTGLHVQSSTPHPVRACAQPHLTHSCAFFLGMGLQH